MTLIASSSGIPPGYYASGRASAPLFDPTRARVVRMVEEPEARFGNIDSLVAAVLGSDLEFETSEGLGGRKRLPGSRIAVWLPGILDPAMTTGFQTTAVQISSGVIDSYQYGLGDLPGL